MSMSMSMSMYVYIYIYIYIHTYMDMCLFICPVPYGTLLQGRAGYSW